MIKFLSSFSKSVGLSIVIVSILEMILPNNKTKKYVRIVMGIFILFNILSPFIKNKEIFNIDNINLENYFTDETSSSVEINQTSMDERIEELYIQELEKDIKNKVNEKGYKVINCKVDVKIGNKDEETKILKIKLKVDKDEDIKNNDEDENMERKIVEEVQKIKTIDIGVNKDKQNDSKELEDDTKISKIDIQNIKKFLIEEYGVSEECLQVN